MRNLILMFITGLILVGCVTEKQRLKICQSCTLASKDSVRVVTTVTPFDTALYVSQMGKDISFNIDSNNCCQLVDTLFSMMARSNGTITAKENGVKSSIFTKNNKLTFRCEADSLKNVITLLRKEIETSREVVKVVPARCDLEHRTKFDGFTFWWFWITSALLALTLGLRFYRNRP